jgi:hypothetical protein
MLGDDVATDAAPVPNAPKNPKNHPQPEVAFASKSVVVGHNYPMT